MHVQGPGDLEESKEVVSFPVEHFLQEGAWQHLFVSLQRSTVLKHSTVAAYLNGHQLGMCKVTCHAPFLGCFIVKGILGSVMTSKLVVN